MPERPDSNDLLKAWLCFLAAILEASVIAAYPEAGLSYVLLAVATVGTSFFWRRYWGARETWLSWQKARQGERDDTGVR